MTKKLVVVGNGMAAGRAIERLIETEPGAYDITIFNAEPRVNYDRIMLSPVLSGEKAYEDILIHDDAWYEINKVNLIKNCKVTEIDRNAKTVTGADGTVADYDKLLIATGSYPFIIPVPGHDLDGVLAYRDLDDVENMIKAAKKPGSRAVVIGGGLLGLEAAYGLKMQGMEVTVLHLMPTLMERQLDEAAGYLLEKAITQRGINIITRANTKAILGVDSVQSVQLDDGRIIPADIVVMAVGIKPNMHLADDAGLETGRGVLVNDNMVTSDPDILSVGECVEHRGQCYGLVAPLYEMANVVADQLSGDAASAYTGSVTSTKLKVTGIDLFSAGDFAEGEGREDIVFRDPSRGVYRRLVLEDNKIIGAVLYGDTTDGAWFFDMLKRGTDVSEMRETLIFGQAYQGGEPLDPMAAVAALPADAEICGCNGVCKSTITGAITDMGLASVDDVRGATKASASCGSCTGLVEQLLAFTLGDEYDAEAVKPMCGCTDLGHGDVRRLIKAKKLQSLPAV
ncbi:MAG: NAD(P)/FAD-dependent oxidoreductase, partial [Pseudomonadota bacterium]